MANRKMLKKYLNLAGFKLAYDNKDAAESIINGIFHKNYITITTQKRSPYIIDCGSHIGISIAFFKAHYPHAQILAFEPDPYLFKLLKENIAVNNIKNITLINKGVYSDIGTHKFFCNHSSVNTDSRGNSFLQKWGNQENIKSQPLYLKTVKLSDYVNKKIDFLKIDIEGAERIVLEELSEKLHLIKEMSIEVHQSEISKKLDNLNHILNLLKKNNFSTSLIEHHISFIPKNKTRWFEKVHPKIFMIHAINHHK